jgi:drug/metabolite transporter (DMT)-like permease
LQARPVEAMPASSWYVILALGLTTALSRLAMFSALQRVGGVETALVGLLELLVSLVLAFLLLGERLTVVQWIGAVLLVFSLMMMVRDPGIGLAQGNVPLEWKRK